MQAEAEKKSTNYSIDQYKIIKQQLGVGNNSKVRLGEANGKQVAIKQYKNGANDLVTYNNEISVISILKDHEHIIQKIDIRPNATFKVKDVASYQCSTIMLEYASGGELLDIVIQTGEFSEKLARSCFLQILKGLDYMHNQKGYAHKDLKPQNILVNAKAVIKLADFGFSRPIKEKNNQFQGTKKFMAPQIYQGNYDADKVDIFAAGIILFIMCIKDYPFHQQLQHNYMYSFIEKKQFDMYWQNVKLIQPLSMEFKRLFFNLVAFNPDQRPNVKNILSDAWLQGQKFTFEDTKKQLQLRINRMKFEKQIRIKQQKQKIRQFRANFVSIGGNRGENYEIDQFKSLYDKEFFRNRKLKSLQTSNPEDFIIEQQLAFSIALLQDFLKNKKNHIKQNAKQNDSEYSQDNYEEIQDGFKIKYILKQEIRKKIHYVELKVQFSEPKDNKISVIITHISGNKFSFKKIAKEIKKLYQYCQA